MSKTGRFVRSPVLICLVASLWGKAYAGEQPPVDCPLREAAYSLESPVMDILLKPEAKAVANSHMNSALDSLPESFASIQPPSFSAIMTLSQIAGMAQIPAANLVPLDRELRALAITNEDREARCARYDRVPPRLDITPGGPRDSGAAVIATLDESSYSPVGRGGQELRMGDHPIVWTRCQEGREVPSKMKAPAL